MRNNGYFKENGILNKVNKTQKLHLCFWGRSTNKTQQENVNI